MLISLLKSKIHRATVTGAEIGYVGSITIDSELMDAAKLKEYEKVQVVDIENGNRIETYVIKGEAKTGIICLNGAAARKVAVGDKIIIMSYCMLENGNEDHCPRVVMVDEKNKISGIYDYEKHGELKESDNIL